MFCYITLTRLITLLFLGYKRGNKSNRMYDSCWLDFFIILHLFKLLNSPRFSLKNRMTEGFVILVKQAVRNSTTFSNKSLLLQRVTWLWHITNFSNIELAWTYLFKLQNAINKNLEKIFEKFFHHKNFTDIKFLYTNPKNGTIAKLQWWELIRNMLSFLVKFKSLHNNVTNFSNEQNRK